MSKLAFLSGSSDPVSDAAPESAPEVVETPQPDGQPRGADGKFLAKDAAETSQPDPVAPEAPAGAAEPTAEQQPPPAPATPVAAPAEPDATQQPPAGYVPVGVIKELRDEIRALKAQPAQPATPAAPPIDPEEDPHGAVKQARDEAHNLRLEWSQKLAEKDHGADAVSSAFEWARARCDQDPAFNSRLWTSADPFGVIMQEHQQNQLMMTLQDPAKRERLLSLLNAETAPAAAPAQPQTPSAPAPAVPPAPPKPAPQAPPRSIASASSAGGPAAVPTGPGVAYDGLFHKG